MHKVDCEDNSDENNRFSDNSRTETDECVSTLEK